MCVKHACLSFSDCHALHMVMTAAGVCAHAALVDMEILGGERGQQAGQLLSSLLRPAGATGGAQQQDGEGIQWQLLARHVLLLQACYCQVGAAAAARSLRLLLSPALCLLLSPLLLNCPHCR
jgi:hypothetical protein